MKNTVNVSAALVSVLLSLSAYASSPREVSCGTVGDVRYTAKQLYNESAVVTGYNNGVQFVLTIPFRYVLGNRSVLIAKFGHNFVYQPYVYDVGTSQSQPELLFVDGTRLICK